MGIHIIHAISDFITYYILLESTCAHHYIWVLLLVHRETELYETIASLSYAGDPRMLIGENPKKVRTNLHEPLGHVFVIMFNTHLLCVWCELLPTVCMVRTTAEISLYLQVSNLVSLAMHLYRAIYMPLLTSVTHVVNNSNSALMKPAWDARDHILKPIVFEQVPYLAVSISLASSCSDAIFLYIFISSLLIASVDYGWGC